MYRTIAGILLVSSVVWGQGWSAIANSRLDSVAPSPSPGGSIGVQAVVSAWSSAVVDTKRTRLVVWGGGHTDYYGNEVYSLSLTGTPAWTRLTNPSTPMTTDCITVDPVLSDGTPPSTHSYGGLVYLPDQDAMFSFGGSIAPCGGMTRKTWLFHFSAWTDGGGTPHAANTWEMWTFAGTGFNPENGASYGGYYEGAMCDYNPIDHKVYCIWGETGYFLRFDPVAKQWTSLATSRFPPGIRSTARIDPLRQRMWFVGETNAGSTTKVGYIDIHEGSSYTVVDVSSSVTGCSALEVSANIYGAPGWAYDPARNIFVGWPANGNTVYLFHPDLMQCVAQTFSGGPATASTAGTYNRFSYIPGVGKYIVVNSAAANAYWFTLDRNSAVGFGGSTHLCVDRDGDGYGTGVPGAGPFSDLAINASSNLRVTSAARPFVSTDVGQSIQVTGGTNFTTGYKRVTRVIPTGSIDTVTINASGSGYAPGSYQVTISGSPGTGTAWLVVNPYNTNTTGAISSVSMAAGFMPTGTGFTSGSTLTTSAFNLAPLTPANWAVGTTYVQYSVVTYAGNTYKSLQAGNVGNQPDTSPAYWTSVGPPTGADLSYTVNTGAPIAVLETSAGTAGATAGQWKIPGCLGPDADDLDDQVWTSAHALTKYGTLLGVLNHLGYNPSRLCYMAASDSSTPGNDATGTCGDATKPYLNFTSIPSVAAGTAVILRTGTYTANNQRITPVAPGGTIGNPMIFISYPGELATFAPSNSAGSLDVWDTQYSVFDGMRVSNGGSGCIRGGSLNYLSYTSDGPPVWKNSIYKHIDGYQCQWGFTGNGMANMSVEDSVFRQGYQHGIYVGARSVWTDRFYVRRVLTFGNPWVGIQWNGVMKNSVIEYVKSYNNSINGVSWLNGTTRSFLRNNVLWGNTSAPFTINNYNSREGVVAGSPEGSPAAGLYVCGATGTEECTCSPRNLGTSCPEDQNYNTVENNVIYHGGYTASGALTGGIAVQVALQNTDGTLNGSGVPACYASGCCTTTKCLNSDLGNNTFRNNIIVSSGASGNVGFGFRDLTKNYMDTSRFYNNLHYNADGTNTGKVAGRPYGSGGTLLDCSQLAAIATNTSGCSYANPLFVSVDRTWYNKPELYDFSLQSSSPAIDAGLSTATQSYDILGNYLGSLTRDRGAYEYTNTTPPPDPPVDVPPSRFSGRKISGSTSR